MKLSILIPTIYGREAGFVRVIEKLKGSYAWVEVKVSSKEGEWHLLECKELPVNIFTLKDNRELKVGEKRNILMDAADGEYVSYHDCDDRPLDDYIKELLEGIESGADIITFNVEVSLNGGAPKPCYYSMYFEKDTNEPNAYYRLPNHLMCVKRELALQVKFLPVNFGEDADYAKRLKPLLKSEYSINKTLYYYDYNSKTTATQK